MEFQEVIAKRHSVRKFADTPVEREKIDDMIRVAETAPSSRNCRSSPSMGFLQHHSGNLRNIVVLR